MDIYQEASCSQFIPYFENLGATGFGFTYDDASSTLELSPSARHNSVRRAEKWSEQQTHVLVQQWKENAPVLESGCHTGMWVKVKSIVDQHGTPKTIAHCKDKIRALRDAYETARDNNNETCASHLLCPYFSIFDEILGSQGNDAVEIIQGSGRPNLRMAENKPPTLPQIIEEDVPMDEDVENTTPLTGNDKEGATSSMSSSSLGYHHELKSLQRAIINARKEHEDRHGKFIRELIGEQKNAQKQRERYSRLLK